ncbi:MAG: DUF1572 domain-containing protein [Flavobacteriaceae bacterium]|nr:DUF1572 domain-containing protein [Flavobacteriaceae bacterium]
MDSNYIESVIKQFTYNKSLGDKTFKQLNDDDIHWKHNEYSNNIAIITKHIVGNILSRWTNFLTEDGEKDWRDRDSEFKDSYSTKEEMIIAWEKGWQCLFDAITPLKVEDLERVIYIRNEGHTVIEAINRQLTHYAYHIGQIVFIGTLIKNNDWKSLSVPKNQSTVYNQKKFNKEKHRGHFTDDL